MTAVIPPHAVNDEDLRIVVLGTPAPQGSKQPRAKIGAGGKLQTWTTEQNKVPVDQWRSDVKSAASGFREAQSLPQFTGPVMVRMVFSFRRPDSHYGTGRNSKVLKSSAPERPVTKGDLDKLARSTCDALTAAGVWKDDKLVSEFGRLAKVWCSEDVEALGVPGAVIIISPL